MEVDDCIQDHRNVLHQLSTFLFVPFKILQDLVSLSPVMSISNLLPEL
jgi:hypothetical protein